MSGQTNYLTNDDPDHCRIHTVTRPQLAPGQCHGGSDFEIIIFKVIIENSSLSTRGEITQRLMPQTLIDKKSALVRVMVWCRQATSHYLNQCWPRSMSPYGITRPKWLPRKFNQNTNIFFRECIFEKVDKIMVIKCRSRFSLHFKTKYH